MNKKPKFSSLFLSLCVVLASAPLPARAQVFESAGAAVSPASVSAAAAARTAAPSLAAPLSISAPALAPALSLSAPVTAMTPDRGAVPAAAVPTAVAAAAAAFAAEPIAAPAADPADARYRVPGPAATGIAAEAEAYAADRPAAAPAHAPAANISAAPTKGVLGRLADAMRGRANFGAIFDGGSSKGDVATRSAPPLGGRMDLKEHRPLVLPNGTAPDEQPTIPSPDREQTVVVQSYSLPGARSVGGILETNRRVLSADPEDPAAVVTALKSIIDADRALYGVSSADLRLVHAKKIAGQGDQADSIFVVFRQLKDGLLVHGSSLSFTLKVINGKPQIVAQTGQIFPQMDVDTGGTMSDDDIRGRIAARIGATPQDVADNFQFFEEKIVYSHGAWRHVKLYVADGLPVMVAVDLANGLVFAWDNRAGVTNRKKKKDGDAASANTVTGKAVDHGPITPTAKISSIPLGFLNLTVGGKTYTTDVNGQFSAPDLQIAPEGLTLSATLSGPYVNVQDASGQTLTVNLTLKPGNGAIKVIFNPDANLSDENALAQVSAFHKVNFAYNFLKVRGLTTDRMDKNAIVVKSNIDDECNAFYTPGSPSLNFFKSSANCVNSAYDTVADHEYGHYWDDMTGGIMNGGLSEGWGDTLSMYSLNNPVIGEHFLKTPREDGQDYIRHGENTYQYNEYDEVHAQGQAWQGFTWKLRKALMKQLGDAEGAAVAEALVLPTMFAKAATIPAAMAQVLVNAMKKDGTIQYESLIRATAKIHGIPLPENKSVVASLVDLFTAPLSRVTSTEMYEGGLDETSWTPVMWLIESGSLTRQRVADEIRRYMDQSGIKYLFREKKGWASSKFTLILQGSKEEKAEHARNISNWLKTVERSTR